MLTKLENQLRELFVNKAPPMSGDIKNFIIKYAPWLEILVIIFLSPYYGFSLPGDMFYLPYARPLYPSFINPWRAIYGIFDIIRIISLLMAVMAVIYLFRQNKAGWRLVYYSTLLFILLHFFSGNLLTAVLLIFVLYGYFQIND